MSNQAIRELILLGTKGGPALRKPGVSFLPTSNLLCFGARRVIVDCGLGVTQALAYAGHSPSLITDIFITHLHSDHVLELGGLIHTAWVSGLRDSLVVYGPKGIKNIWARFIDMMQVDINVRIVDEGRPDLRDLVVINEYAEGDVILGGDVEVKAINTIHPPLENCFALSFMIGGRKICFSGDTAFLPRLAEFAEGAAILVHEAMLQSGIKNVIANTGNTDKRLHEHLLSSHTFARDAARIARDAKVDVLVLNHLIPAERSIAGDDDWIAETRKYFSGQVFIAADGMRIPF